MPKGFYLYKEGDSGNFFYIVKEGELELTYNTGENKVIKAGDSFGELALIQKNTRSSTVTSLTDIEIYCLEGEIFKDIILKDNDNNLKERIKLLSNNPIFNYFPSNLIHEIAINMLKCEYEKGEIIEENQLKDSLFLIIEGSFYINSFENNKISLRNLNQNNFNKNNNYLIKDYFGLSGLIYSYKRYNFNISITERSSKCFKLTKDVLVNILGEDFLKKIFENLMKNAIGKIKMLKLLTNEQYFLKIFPIFKLNIYYRNEVVFDLNINDNNNNNNNKTNTNNQTNNNNNFNNFNYDYYNINNSNNNSIINNNYTEQKFVIILEGNLINVNLF
jgi:CRP-like cAMP-binding protein